MRNPKIRIDVTAPPTFMPVSLHELKAELVIEGNDIDEDALMESYIAEATERAEKFTNRAIGTQSISIYSDVWPGSVSRHGDPWWDGVKDGSISMLPPGRRYFTVPRPPLQSVTQILTYDDADVSTVYSSTKYLVDTKSEPGRIYLRDGAETPAPTRVALGIQIDIIAGFGNDPSDIPEGIRKGILLMAAFLHRHRGECPPEVAAVQSGASGFWQRWRIRKL